MKYGSQWSTLRRYKKNMMRGNRLAAAVLLMSSVAISGCTMMNVNSSKDTSFVLSSDVKADMHNLKLSEMNGELLPLSESISFDELLFIQGGKMLFNRKDGMYSANIVELDDKAPVRLLKVQATHVSRNGKMALYDEKNITYILEVESGEKRELFDKGKEEYRKYFDSVGTYHKQFVDEEGHYVAFGRPGFIYLVEIATGTTKTIKLADYFHTETLGYNSDVEVVNNELYIHLSGEGVPEAIYIIKLDSQNPEEAVMLRKAENQDDLSWFDIMSDGRILFSGEHDQETGVFIYDAVTKETSKLVGKAYDREYPSRGYAFSLSPDEKKLLIDDLEENAIILGDLDGNQFVKKEVVMQGYELNAIIPLLTFWSQDSQTFYMKISSHLGKDVWAVENIVRFKAEGSLSPT